MTQIISVAIPRPLQGLFTYKLPEHLSPLIKVGGLVKVPFHRSVIHAFVVEPPKELSELPPGLSLHQLRDVLEVGSTDLFPEDVWSLCRWAHEYYMAPWGEILNCAVPIASLDLKGNPPKKMKETQLKVKPGHPLTEDQKAALEFLENLRKERAGRTALLKGVTGSGKTEIYIELAKNTLADQKGVLILVPEIALTPQLHERFEESLGVPVALWHSAVSKGKRRDQSAALRRGELKVVVGARSAVFAPVAHLGLIVVDEEHDPTFKQEDRVRYHARDLAVVRAKLTCSLTVLGSATPSLETRERVREGRYFATALDRRIAPGGMPRVEIVNLCEEPKLEGIQAPIALKTIQTIQETVAAGEQVMIYLNRRGFAAFLLCKDCGQVKGCPDCSISLTVYKRDSQLRCHVCGYSERIPDQCGKCQGLNLQEMGAGTESLESEIPQFIEGAKILRLDRDQVTSATRLGKVLESFRKKEANILLGTQMLVKGHDFPGVTLVVVVLADALFRWPDFRSPERAYQILKQVAGRAGRGEKPGRVLIQTYDEEHAVLQALQEKIPESQFLEGERELRLALGYPPFGRLARLRFESRFQDEANGRADAVAKNLRHHFVNEKLDVLGPSEAFLKRAKGIYRWDLLLKSNDVRIIQKAIYFARECGSQKGFFLTDVDPYSV